MKPSKIPLTPGGYTAALAVVTTLLLAIIAVMLVPNGVGSVASTTNGTPSVVQLLAKSVRSNRDKTGTNPPTNTEGRSQVAVKSSTYETALESHGEIGNLSPFSFLPTVVNAGRPILVRKPLKTRILHIFIHP